MEISFIGAGNLAWHLAPALENAGHHINEVYSRQLQHSRQLISNLYDAQTHSDLNFADSPSQLFVLAVPDDALETVCSRLVLPEKAILVHTSGNQSLSVLENWMTIYSDIPVQTGVFYGLQTFTKGQPFMDFRGVPLCIEATDKETEDVLVRLGQELSDIVYIITSAERRALHVAAVFACNFTNHLLAIAHDLTTTNGLEFDLLQPIIRETIRKGLAVENPATVQTGPARRGDLTTIESHLSWLAIHPQLAEIYQLMTQSIKQQYS
ncbi:Rossmann-like and DUF2520 domain-containing protein [Spirosoma oryzicola]|uniref:Rossmann-like and DUF2520 domain-containing protein n=1 Tax=Spirosoma oryzicola TaxID=2898794 RepID=UPI001E5D760B|nr:Rossmann-like and DUF2520 domain-containing protein [Spirosoma oryzicola]UHG90890.1 DUF2520 domain-containing protein [Spirosoma oryzicola]